MKNLLFDLSFYLADGPR